MITSPQRVMALVAKDFRIHGRDIAFTQAGLMGLFAFAVYLKPGEAALNASLVFNFNFVLAGFWSEWLISREKTKGTFAWLRASPVSDRDLVLSKFIAVGICCLVFWSLSTAVFVRGYLFPDRFAIWMLLQVALLVFGALAIATRWRFGQKLGQMLPYGIVAGLVGALIVAERMAARLPGDPDVLLRNVTGQLLLGAFLVAAYLVLFWGTLTWVRRTDTSNLLE